MATNGVIQVPFDAFRIIDLGQTVGLQAYQALYDDRADPVGLLAVIQCMGLIKVKDEAVETFTERLNRNSARSRLGETGVELVTGKSTTSGHMLKTRGGESALLVLSFLLEVLGEDGVGNFARRLVDTTPPSRLSSKPRRRQVLDVVSAVNSQTSCVSWSEELSEAQKDVMEYPLPRRQGGLSSEDRDIPVEALSAFYHALCTVSRFPETYHCSLTTPYSLTLAYGLAHCLCGLRVCVVVNGETVHGNAAIGKWQVRLEKKNLDAEFGRTTVRLGRPMGGLDDLLVTENEGLVRRNRMEVRGLGQRYTLQQGLGLQESEELAAMAIGVAISALSKWRRIDGPRESRNRALRARITALQLSATTGSPSDSWDEHASNSRLLSGTAEPGSRLGDRGERPPTDTSLLFEHVQTWWGIEGEAARRLWQAAESELRRQPDNASWSDLHFGQAITQRITEYNNEQDGTLRRRLATSKMLWSLSDFVNLLHDLATQLVLIAFADVQSILDGRLRVRGSTRVCDTRLGVALDGTKAPEPLERIIILESWCIWVSGSDSPVTLGSELVSVDGYMVYQTMLLSINLDYGCFERVAIEPGHVEFEEQRWNRIEDREFQTRISVGEPAHHELLTGPALLQPMDRAGQTSSVWYVEADEEDDVLSLDVLIRLGHTYFQTSPAHIIRQGWTMQVFGDRSLVDCKHDRGSPAQLADGEAVYSQSPGKIHIPGTDENIWRDHPSETHLRLYRTRGNLLGQIACLLGEDDTKAGLIRRDACLRCCITAALDNGFDFVID